MTGNTDGSVSLFNGSKLEKTKRLGGNEVHVDYSNGQIVAAIRNGNLTIMNESLGIIKEFSATEDQTQSINGNETYLAFCDAGGSVQYYARNSNERPKVILHRILNVTKLLRTTCIMAERAVFK